MLINRPMLALVFAVASRYVGFSLPARPIYEIRKDHDTRMPFVHMSWVYKNPGVPVGDLRKVLSMCWRSDLRTFDYYCAERSWVDWAIGFHEYANKVSHRRSVSEFLEEIDMCEGRSFDIKDWCRAPRDKLLSQDFSFDKRFLPTPDSYEMLEDPDVIHALDKTLDPHELHFNPFADIL